MLTILKVLRSCSSSADKEIPSLLAESLFNREKLFNAGVRLLKINRKSYPFMVKMGKSVRYGAMATTLATSPDNENSFFHSHSSLP